MAEQKAKRMIFPACYAKQQIVVFLRRSMSFLVLFLLFSSTQAHAQFGSMAGLVIALIGMVQVEPGPNVLTLGVKGTEIRFAAQDVESIIKDFSTPQFLSDLRHHSPSLDVRGSDELLEKLLKERPSKRVLKLKGRYYQDSRKFILNDIDVLEDIRKQQP